MIKRGEEKTHLNSSNFEVIDLEGSEYEAIKSGGEKEKGKTRVVVPLGTNNDTHFEEYLKKEDYKISYDFPID